MIQDSGGPGRRRGGLGVRRVFEVIDDQVTFSGYSDRFRFRPWGLFGGKPGAPSSFYVMRNGEKISLPSKANFNFKKGDRFVIEVAGGGGYGPPYERERERVLQDLIEGRISLAQAIDEYRLDRETADRAVV
jgi:N-methylhydantoinase B